MNINNNTKVELVTVGSLFQDIGWENPVVANDVEWITLQNIGANTHYYAWNDYSTAVRNTPEIRERVVSFWTARLQQEIDCPVEGNYTQKDKDRCVAWTERMLGWINRQIAEGQSWLLIRVAPEEEAAVRATLA